MKPGVAPCIDLLLRLHLGRISPILEDPMQQQRPQSRRAEHLIARAQKLARDSERHALLSESLAARADRMMDAGLRLLTRDAVAHPADRH
jgi:hypothetical protein